VVVNANDVLITTAEPIDEPGRRIYTNEAFTRVTGQLLQEVWGKTPRLLQDLRPTEPPWQDSCCACLATSDDGVD